MQIVFRGFMDPHEEAFDAVRTWWRAWVERDLETVQRMADPDYTETSETRQLRPKGIDQLLDEASRCASDVAITHWEIFDPVTKLFEHTVVCNYCFRISGRRGGRVFCFEGRASDVLEKKNGRWTYVSHYGTFEADHR